MDPRPPAQHPFSRNTTSPYGRNTYPPTSQSQPSNFPPSSHAPTNTPSSFPPEHQRRPSEPHYSTYTQRSYGGEGGPPGPLSGHSRHQSASSATPVNRMPPPSSPQQGNTQHGYGMPPRASAAPGGQPSGFSSGRELPALPLPPNRPGMSISDILGGPSPAAREQPPRQYGSPVSTAGPQNSIFAGSNHASPRMSATPDYAPFRRPHTPEHQRMAEPRDHRANSAGSPPGIPYNPETRRYGTPQTYGQRNMPPTEERREPIRVPNPNPAPPRPRSQPGVYASRPTDPRTQPTHTESLFGRREHVRSESVNREPAYQRSEYESGQAPYSYAERVRQEREAALLREREQRELRDREIREREIRERELREQRELEHREQQRERAAVERSAMQQEYAHQVTQRNSQSHSRPENKDQVANRDHLAWLRYGYDPPRPPYEPIPEQQPHQREPLDYPRTTESQYGGHPAYANRYTPSSQASSIPPQQSSSSISHFEAEMRERQRLTQQQQEQQRQAVYGGPPQSAPYQNQESPTRRPLEDAQQLQQQAQRPFLGVQEMNRKGRISPLPQAVQGAQGPIGGHGGEPGIKSEFGRMFSGIGSGVGAMNAPSPVTGGPPGPPNSGQLRREDLDAVQGLDSPTENGGFGYNLTRSTSRGGRRRKLKDEDSRDDDTNSTGRRTPSGRGGKRQKTHNHAHQPHSHHIHKHQPHHRIENLENGSSPLHANTPFKNSKGTIIPSPPDVKSAPVLHHHHVSRHHHHQITPSKIEPARNAVIRLAKKIVRSQAVLDSVANLPRRHLGHGFYKATLNPSGASATVPRSQIGYESTPEPLPNFEGSENCTYAVKVPRSFLVPERRKEITYRKAVWGSDIYTDDSDIIAACIHQGWFRGEWADDVDPSLLGLEIGGGPPESPKDYLTEPPPRGPMHVPEDRDLIVTILVLPRLEKYSSLVRFGIKSREWGGNHDGYKGEHDGISFLIMSIRWVDGLSGNSAERKENMATSIQDDVEDNRQQGLWPLNEKYNQNGAPEESFERGGGRPLNVGEIVGIGSQSWWKTKPKPKISIMASDKENVTNGDSGLSNGNLGHGERNGEQKAEIQRVTDRMVENASVHATENESV